MLVILWGDLAVWTTFVNSVSVMNRKSWGRKENVYIRVGLSVGYCFGLVRSGEHSSDWVVVQDMCLGQSMN